MKFKEKMKNIIQMIDAFDNVSFDNVIPKVRKQIYSFISCPCENAEFNQKIHTCHCGKYPQNEDEDEDEDNKKD